MRDAREAALCEKPLPRAPSRRAAVGDDWGRCRFSKRSASPPDPLSRRVAGNRLVCSFGGSRPCCVGAVSCCLCVVTAADRAAATCLRWGRKALFTRTTMTGLSLHGRLRQTSKGFSPQRKLSCAVTRMTEDTPPAPHVRGGSVSRRGLIRLHQRASHLSGGTKPAESTPPNASRSSGVGGLGGEALLSEKRPLPPESPSPSHSIHDRPMMPGPPWVPTTVPISSCMMGGRLERLEVRWAWSAAAASGACA